MKESRFDLFVTAFLKDPITFMKNAHFTTYFTRCRICDIDIKWIGKVETAREDKHFVFEKLQIPNYSKYLNEVTTPQHM